MVEVLVGCKLRSTSGSFLCYNEEYHVFILSVTPDDHSRVVLSAPDEEGSDYINASYIDVSIFVIDTKFNLCVFA